MCDEKDLYYNNDTKGYAVPAKITFDRLCNGYTVRNAGNTIVVINDEEIQPGQSKAVGGNRNEIFIGRLDIFFRDQTVQPVPRTPYFYVTQKFYVELDVTDSRRIKK